MGKKSKDRIRVSFVGGNATDVTGSCTHISMPDYQLLLECGLYQSNSAYNDYKNNSSRFDFSVKDIDFIFVGHSHIDHIGRIPLLYARGCGARIIAPRGTKALFTILALDSAHIIQSDAEQLSRTKGKKLVPYYTEDDVQNAASHIEEYDYGEKIELNDSIVFRFVPSQHIVGAAQIELWLSNGNQTSKILYTSDLGNVSVDKPYVKQFQAVQKANIVIGETTYAGTRRSATAKDREKDIEKIRSVIKSVCIDNNSKVLIPIFSMDRCQSIFTILYDLFAHDPDFDIPVIVDSPLACKISKLYSDLLSVDDLTKYQQVLDWDNLHFVSGYDDSVTWQHSNSACIVLAASGFMTASRSRMWAKTLLPNPKAHILFVGYSTENSLASKIKHGKEQHTISIDKKPYKNRCNVTDLISMSSHMQHDDLLKYYSDICAEKIILVHGNMDDRIVFADELKDMISKKNKCGRVIIANKNTEICL